MTTCYPPTHHHNTTRIPASTALSLLSAYLEATATDPALHPNALLTDGGPVAASSDSNTGLVLHNLRRVEAGLKGEQLGADLALEQFAGDGLPDLGAENAVALPTDIPDQGLDCQGDGAETEWQDKAEFERQQDVVQGEIGKRGALSGGLSETGQIPRVKATKSAGEIDARKEAKKERKKKERRRQEEKRKAKDIDD